MFESMAKCIISALVLLVILFQSDGHASEEPKQMIREEPHQGETMCMMSRVGHLSCDDDCKSIGYAKGKRIYERTGPICCCS
ncbi:hypothetical protein QJS04_geneDACA017856 [Acorus gramineus]|uniref:Uncharacterized protein n=1 Tax=Acorus gramineus TaxID=55184 RepID=A0AAV9AKA3_ACOGR|nr:hypothetical protein QJS04_geneDACA017856 [Acorus gramineus]